MRGFWTLVWTRAPAWVKIDHIDITAVEFEQKMADFQQNLTALFAESKDLESQIQQQMATLKFNAQVVKN